VTLGTSTFFWLAVTEASKIGNYTRHTIIAYFVIAAFHDFIFVSGDEFAKKIGESIRAGKLSSALVQPFPYLVKLFANGMGGISLRIGIVSLIAILIRFTILKDFVLEDPMLQIGFYALALLLAILVSLLCLIITGLLAFDMTQVWAPWVCFIASYCFFSGIFFPADQASGLVKDIMQWLPFYYIIGFPAVIFIGHLGFEEIVLGFQHGIFILLYLSLLLAFMWKRGIKKFEAIGI
jgi:ABC-2 type transport system permease protein